MGPETSAGEVETAWARQSRAGDGVGREMVKMAVQERVRYSPLNCLKATPLPASSME